MIRKATSADLDTVMEIWLDTNLHAHAFIPAEYWHRNYEAVRAAIAGAEVYVFEDKMIRGFVGVVENYVAGMFVKNGYQSRGIGGALMHHLQKIKTDLSLHVYESNQKAVGFYLREGFRISEKRFDEDTHQMEYSMIWKK